MSDSNSRHGRWTQEEDQELRTAVSEQGGREWKQIAANVPGRSPIQCLHRWSKILRPGLVKGPWVLEEDVALNIWVSEHGPTKCTQCALQVAGRSGKQCRERWLNVLDPSIKRGNWAHEEDEVIFRTYKDHGPRWTELASQLPGRTENSIKNRFYSQVKKKRRVKSEDVKGEKMVVLIDRVKELETMLIRTRTQILAFEASLNP